MDRNLHGRRRTAALLIALGLLAGCAAAGVPQSDDPYVKLRQAEEMDRQGRLAVEERLIKEAIALSEAQGDELALAEAYRSYAFYVRQYPEGAILRRVPQGAAIQPVDDPARLDLSIDYFERARALAERQGRFDLVSNIELNIGGTHQFAGRIDAACAAFDRSAAAQEAATRANPDGDLVLPPGIATYEELMETVRRQAGCP